jgi:flagellar hook assembly protein FlgD
MQNYPNPFNPATTIEFSLPEKSEVTLNIYSSLGELVTTLAAGSFDAGYHTVNFDASKLTSGTYMYQITANYAGKIFTSTKKMSLVK